MQKRRERIEKWRSERKKEEIPLVVLPPSKKWSLEDDDDEDEAEADSKAGAGDADDVDPLDAFMQVHSMLTG